MKKTIAFTLGLLVVAAALATYILLVENKEPPPAPTEWQPTPVLAVGQTVNQLTLVRASGNIVFHAVPNTKFWKIIEPVQAVAEPVYTDMMMRDVTEMQREKIIDVAPNDLAKYALDRPQGEIIAHYVSGHPDTHVLIGKLNYNQDHLYAKLADQPTVFLIKPDFAQYLTATLSDFRSKALFISSPAEVLSMEIKIEDPELLKEYPYALQPKLVVQSQPSSAPVWAIVSPIQENADFGQIKQFFNRLTHVYAKDVYDAQPDKLAPYGLDKPVARILFTMLNGGREEIDFGARDPRNDTRYARNTFLTQVVPISEDFFAYLINSNFRSTKVLANLKIVNLSSLSLQFPAAPQNDITINKEKVMLFALARDPAIKVTGGRLNTIISPFMQNNVVFIHQVEPLPLKQYGLDPGNVRITAYDGANLALDVVLGNTVSESGITRTYLEDNIRKAVVLSPVNLYDIIPLQKKYLQATPEEIQRIENRRKRFK